MADKSTQLVLTALSRALAEPDGAPLYSGKGLPGLFASTPLGRQAAQRCKDEGYLHTLRTEVQGKTALEFCTLTEKGRAYLLTELNPRHVLEDLLRALEARHAQASELVHLARQMQHTLDGLKTTTETVLQQLPPVHASSIATTANPSRNGHPDWKAQVLSFLNRWHAASPSEDCPLPELYRQLLLHTPELTIGQFHDGLRELNAGGQICLHPWTGPLYLLPEPPFALLVGHEIAYYANRRF